jgi:putative hydrolase of the HAD superfamily
MSSLTKTSYTTIFFDLDHTLWDYETSARETLRELYDHYLLNDLGIASFDDFHQQFRTVNQQLWHLYDHGKIGSEVIRAERFKQILAHFNVHEESVSQKLSADYLDLCPRKGNLMPGALQALNYLSKRYRMTVITNGFDDVQRIKLEAGNITQYFNHIITSQKAGYKKPAREIFDFALEENKIEAGAAIMIGDNLATDIAGARNAAIDVIFYNPDRLDHQASVTHEIRHLEELCSLL